MGQETKSGWIKLLLTVIRVAIGWHFLYEGFTKWYISGWTAQSFLANTSGFLSGFYHWIASTPAVMKTVDILNVYGLVLIGLALFMGIFTRLASLSGAFLLALYYFAYPPFGPSLFGGGEGNLYIVDKLFIEAVVLVFLAFYKEKGYGLEALIALYRREKKKPAGKETPVPVAGSGTSNRREVIKNLATLPILGILGWKAFDIQKKYGVDVMSGATIQVRSSALNELSGTLPKGKLGEHEITRLVLGGNLIGGWAHARDLIYVNTLFKAYNTEKKVFETLMLAENAGINIISVGSSSIPMINKYRSLTGSRMKMIAQVGLNSKSDNIYEAFDKAIDEGADILQLTGNWCDWLVRDGKTEVIGKLLDYTRRQGYTAGLGAHTIDSLIICEENGIIPDYYMKTMHHDNYWSAHPRENRRPFEVDGKRFQDHNMFHDNCFCPFPDRTVEFVNRVKVPVMGFKVLAAGAIHPEDGFNWAFKNGADFICVGMFDFQIVENVNTTIKVLGDLQNRDRKWFS